LPGVAGESFALTPDPGRKVRFFERLFLQQGTLEEGFTHEADATDAAPTARWSTTELKRVRGLRFDENQEQPLVTWEGTEDGSAGDAVVATFSFDTARTSYGEVYSPDDGVPRISPNVVWTVSMPPTTTKHPMLDLTPEIAVRWGKPSNLRFEVAFADAEGAEDYEGYLTAATGTVTRSFASDEARDYYYYDY
jgi:hypothetical protein